MHRIALLFLGLFSSVLDIWRPSFVFSPLQVPKTWYYPRLLRSRCDHSRKASAFCLHLCPATSVQSMYSVSSPVSSSRTNHGDALRQSADPPRRLQVRISSNHVQQRQISQVTRMILTSGREPRLESYLWPMLSLLLSRWANMQPASPHGQERGSPQAVNRHGQ